MFRFNIRVYGILVNESRQVLLADELIRGEYFTKFPGGGLEYGEGTRECLAREFREEMNLKIEVLDHIYTTDIFQESAFHRGHQIISIYYWVKALEPITARISEKEFDFDEGQLAAYEDSREIETFRFIDWDELTEDKVSLPLDKIVVKMIKGISAA